MKQPYANDNFEAFGIKMLVAADDFGKVRSEFDECCIHCRFRPRPHDCKACPIRATLLSLAEAGWHTLSADDQLYVERERASCDD